jgi:hypothetical protein
MTEINLKKIRRGPIRRCNYRSDVGNKNILIQSANGQKLGFTLAAYIRLLMYSPSKQHYLVVREGTVSVESINSSRLI